MSKTEELRKELDKAHEEHLKAMIATKKSYAAVREIRRTAEQLEQEYAANNKTQLAAERSYSKLLSEYLETAIRETPQTPIPKSLEIDW